MEEAAQSGSYQRHRQQQADADPVCQVTSEQVGDHTKDAEDASEDAHLGVGQMINLQIGVIVVIPEVGQAVDDGTACGDEQDGNEIPCGLFAHPKLRKQFGHFSFSPYCFFNWYTSVYFSRR